MTDNNPFSELNRLATILWWKRFWGDNVLYKAIDMACIAALLYFAKGLFLQN